MFKAKNSWDKKKQKTFLNPNQLSECGSPIPLLPEYLIEIQIVRLRPKTYWTGNSRSEAQQSAF